MVLLKDSSDEPYETIVSIVEMLRELAISIINTRRVVL